MRLKSKLVILLVTGLIATGTYRTDAQETALPTSIQPPSQPEKYEFEKLGGIVYADYEEKQLECDVYMPKGEGPFPAILAIHGGAWRSGSKLHWSWHSRKFARAGYVVVAINYRHAPRYQYPAQIHDCKKAVRWMRKHAEKYRLDPDRIAAVGYSAGGQLAGMLGTTSSDDGLEGEVIDGDEQFDTRVQAVVVGGAPSDFTWLSEDSNSLSYWLGGSRRSDPEIYRQASPLEFVSEDDPPFFLYHGEDDRLIPVQSPQNMLQALRSAGISADLVIHENSGHLETFSNLDTLDGVIEFLDKHLKDSPAK